MYLDVLIPNLIPSGQEKIENIFNVQHLVGVEFSGLKEPGIAFVTFDSDFSHEIRRNLSKFKNHFKNITIYDLGSLKEIKEKSIIELTSYLATFNIIPVYVGIDVKTAGSLGVENSKNITLISNHIELIEHKNSTTRVNHLAYQRHLCSLNDIYEIEENMYNALSLGKLRSFPAQLEPTLRDTQILHVNLDCMRFSDAPNTNGTLPSGLNAEELCQIMKYVGTADEVSAVFLSCDIITDKYQPEASLIAESIWYFMEGVNMSLPDHPSKSKDFSAFIVHSSSLDDDLEFLKHNQTSKWWLCHTSENQIRHFLACSYDEYQMSVGEEVPDRLLKFINEFENYSDEN
jgi:formiminoglutamase